MSRRKIKSESKPKKAKEKEISLKDAAKSHLFITREARKAEETDKINELIKNGQLDLTKISDYKYMSNIAKSLDWSIGRLLRAAGRVIFIINKKEKQNAKA